MELWVWFSFGTIILNAVLMVIDYNLLGKVYKTAEAPTMVTSLFLIFPFIWGLIYWVDYWDISIIFWSIAIGFLTFLGILYYFKSFDIWVTPTTLGSIMKIQMIFAFIVGVFSLWEQLTWPLSKVTFLNETYPVLLILSSLTAGYYYPNYFPKEGWKNKLATIAIVIIWWYECILLLNKNLLWKL